MQIITNHHDREFLYSYDVPQSVIDDYDHLDQDENFDGWIHYRNTWYHVSDFMDMYTSTNHPTDFDTYHGQVSDSFFSGVLIKLTNDNESYRIATYIA